MWWKPWARRSVIQLLHLLESNPEAQRDLLEFRHTLEASCAYYAALRATDVDRERLTAAFNELQDCYSRHDEVSRAEEGAADANFHLAIAEASHNADCFCTPFAGYSTCSSAMWSRTLAACLRQRTETRDMLIKRVRVCIEPVIEGQGGTGLSGSLQSTRLLCSRRCWRRCVRKCSAVAQAERRKGM